MITENLSTLKIHKLTQAQYDRELAAGNIDENAFYLTPDEAVDMTGYATEEYVDTALAEKQPVGNYLTEIPDEYITNDELQAYAQPKGNYLTAVPNEYVTEEELTAKGYLTGYTETDPTVPAWAKQSTKPTYTASEVGADASGTASSLVASHNIATDAHEDIRGQISQLSSEIAAINRDAIIEEVITALGTPVFGRVDAENNIVLTGNLADGIYTLKYEDADGNLIEIGTLDMSPEYTNMIPLSTEADGTPYNGGQGWKSGTRLNSSGVESTSSAEGIEVTGFIPVAYGDVIRLKNITIKNLSADEYGYSAQTYLTIYDSEKNVLVSKNISYLYIGSTDVSGCGLTLDEPNGNIIEMRTDELYNPNHPDIDWRQENMAFFRISCEEINADSIITINQEISESESESEQNPEVAYTNQIPISTDTDGSIYNGTGYKVGCRINSSGVLKENESSYAITGFIPFTANDVLYLSKDIFDGNPGSCAICAFDASKTFIANTAIYVNNPGGTITVDSNGNYVFDPRIIVNGASLWQNTAYIRITGVSSMSEKSTITINEPIIDSEGGILQPSYTNQIPISTDTDGSIYNGTGYKANTRYSSSSSTDITHDGCYITGYIPVTADAVVRIANMTMDKNIDDGNKCFAYLFDTEKANGKKIQVNTGGAYTFDGLSAVWDSSGYLTQFTVPSNGFIRLQSSYIDSNSIITVNEEIV